MLSLERAAEIAVNTTTGLFAPVYAQINPARVGEVARSLNIAYDYAKRLPGNIEEKGVARLVFGFPSHSFVIDRDEACSIFKNVRGPTPDEAKLAQALKLDSVKAAWRHQRTVRYKQRQSTTEPTGGSDDDNQAGG